VSRAPAAEDPRHLAHLLLWRPGREGAAARARISGGPPAPVPPGRRDRGRSTM